jgi:hypothetical protein
MGQARIQEQFDIELMEGAMERLTKKRSKPYPIKGDFKAMLNTTLEEMEKVGVGINNPPNFYPEIATPTFFTKNKAKWRMVHDYKNLNDETRDMVYPIPLISTILESLKGKKYFSLIDLKSGYYQFRLSERARKLCAVISPRGIFRFDCLPMGLKNAPPIFQKIMYKILEKGLNIYVFVYIDDVIIFSSSFHEHLGHISLVLDMLREANLKANIEKCNFCLSQLRVLGKVISSEGMKTDPELVSSMVNYPIPTSARKVKGFIAMLNFYREHLVDFGPKTEPLAELARDDFKWDKNTWTSNPKYQQCFDELKKLMLTAPILAYPNFNESFHIQSDASKYGAGAVLYQYDDFKRVVVSYASWLFNPAQRKYNTTERELLAIVLSTRKWKPYLRRTHFIAETDHQPLEGYLNLNDPYGKIARWAAELTQFYFSVKYIKGITNIPPDTLSRLHEDCLMMEWWAPKALASANSFEEEEFICILETEEEVIGLNQLNFSWPTDEEFIEAYKIDNEFSNIYIYIKENKVPQASIVNGVKNDTIALNILRKAHLFLIGEDGKLYYYSDKKNNPNKLVLCVPQKYTKLILEETHDSLWAGAHMGRDKTLDKIRDKYYFSNMKNYVSWYIKSCIPCQESKRKNPMEQLPWGTIEAEFTWDLLCLDLWDSGVVSTRGNKYILTIIDGFSKFAHAIPIRNKEAKTIAKTLVEKVFCSFGKPKRLHSDRGSEFVNGIITKLSEIYLIDLSKTTAYHPQGNAYAERIHQFFRNTLAAFVRRDQRDWDALIPILVSVYNDSMHQALGGYSPAQVMFGRNLNNPIQLPLQERNNPSNYISSLRLALDRVQQIVLEQTYTKLQKNLSKKEGYKFEKYNLGDKVAVSVEYLPAGFESAKLYPRWKGPYEIIKLVREGKVLYLKDLFGKEIEHPVSILRVKRWYDRKETYESDEKSLEESENEQKSQNDLNQDEELQKRLIERIEGDVNITENNLVDPNQEIQIKPIRGKRKDWNFIDTKEFQSSSNQKVNLWEDLRE